jgi:hypothetical protein
LPHKAFALQISQNHGLQNVAPLRSRVANASATIAMPFQRTMPLSFCLISPEAVLLTGENFKFIGSINEPKRERELG